MLKFAMIALGFLTATNALAGSADEAYERAWREAVRSGEELDRQKDAAYQRRHEELMQMSRDAEAGWRAERERETLARGLNRIGDDLERQNLFLCCPH